MHCTVQGYGIGITTGFGANFLIVDTVVTSNQTGIGAVFADGTLDHVVASFNTTTGVSVTHGSIRAVDTVANQNGTGFEVSTSGHLLLAHSTVIGNGTGVALAGGSVTSFGDNHIKGNGTDVKGGTLTNVGTQ